ncbi:MAG: hypothetical protein K6D98_03480 [Clostridiales bacterium]|nr:hypothetical protein [Clostridiales bacterium]
MYSRNYNANASDGTVRAFENAFAKEEFLKKCASGRISGEDDENLPENSVDRTVLSSESGVVKCKNTGIFGSDNGDLLLLLLIVFFFVDGEKENDSLIPVLLALLLLF